MFMKLKAILLLLSIFVGVNLYAQTANDSLPYLQHPELPAFRLQMMDSTTVLNTYNIKQGKKTVLMLFSPDCEHCQHMADSMRNHMEEMQDVQIYMFSFMDLYQIKNFAAKYKLNRYKNITFGKDVDFFFAGFYKLTSVPGIAIYDKKKKFVKLFNGGAKIEDLLAAIKD
jgi:thioredoxin-related protein